MPDLKICKGCGHPVIVEAGRYEIFERMHWVCFHYEYEHVDADPDEPCGDPSCPMAAMAVRAAAQAYVDTCEVFCDPAAPEEHVAYGELKRALDTALFGQGQRD